MKHNHYSQEVNAPAKSAEDQRKVSSQSEPTTGDLLLALALLDIVQGIMEGRCRPGMPRKATGGYEPPPGLTRWGFLN